MKFVYYLVILVIYANLYPLIGLSSEIRIHAASSLQNVLDEISILLHQKQLVFNPTFKLNRHYDSSNRILIQHKNGLQSDILILADITNHEKSYEGLKFKFKLASNSIALISCDEKFINTKVHNVEEFVNTINTHPAPLYIPKFATAKASVPLRELTEMAIPKNNIFWTKVKIITFDNAAMTLKTILGKYVDFGVVYTSDLSTIYKNKCNVIYEWNNPIQMNYWVYTAHENQTIHSIIDFLKSKETKEKLKGHGFRTD